MDVIVDVCMCVQKAQKAQDVAAKIEAFKQQPKQQQLLQQQGKKEGQPKQQQGGATQVWSPLLIKLVDFTRTLLPSTNLPRNFCKLLYGPGMCACTCCSVQNFS